ncbi:MAG: Crp/Fnr family transcriptional regulator [Bacteroidales bacterium]|nr:Crp/Fnr family transcriptional regulator [Bacteroidales bacterium]
MNQKSVLNSCTVNYDTYDCFEKLSDEELKLLESNRVEVSYKKGETLCKQGTFASHIMYICKGLVKVYVENDRDSLILKILPEGNLIGLTSLYDGNNIFQYSAIAYQDSLVRLIDINIFRQLLKQNPEFANEVINILCENSIQTYGRFFCFTHKQSYGRMADILLCLACRIYKKNEFDLLLSRKELAELTGLSTERVIRIIKKFKDDGLISMDGKTFKIVDHEKLQKISDHG